MLRSPLSLAFCEPVLYEMRWFRRSSACLNRVLGHLCFASLMTLPAVPCSSLMFDEPVAEKDRFYSSLPRASCTRTEFQIRFLPKVLAAFTFGESPPRRSLALLQAGTMSFRFVSKVRFASTSAEWNHNGRVPKTTGRRV